MGIPGWPGTCYVAEDDIELEIYLFLPLKGWDYRYAPHPHFHAAGNGTQNFFTHARQISLPTEPSRFGFFCCCKMGPSGMSQTRLDGWGYHTRSRHADYAGWASMTRLLLPHRLLNTIQKTLFRTGLPGNESRLVRGLESPRIKMSEEEEGRGDLIRNSEVPDQSVWTPVT